MDFVIAGVLAVVAVLIVGATQRDMRDMKAFRERFRTVVGDDDSSKTSGDQRRQATRELRDGRAVSDPMLGPRLVREYDAVGAPPDFTRRSSIVAIGGSAGLCLVGLLEGSGVLAIGALIGLVFFLAIATWKWRMRRAIERSIAATRQLHQSVRT